MISTFGALSRALGAAGQAGWDSSIVRPMTPGNASPDLYSFNAISTPFVAPYAARASQPNVRRPGITRFE